METVRKAVKDVERTALLGVPIGFKVVVEYNPFSSITITNYASQVFKRNFRKKHPLYHPNIMNFVKHISHFGIG